MAIRQQELVQTLFLITAVGAAKPKGVDLTTPLRSKAVPMTGLRHKTMLHVESSRNGVI